MVRKSNERLRQSLQPSIPLPCLLAIACIVGIFISGFTLCGQSQQVQIITLVILLVVLLVGFILALVKNANFFIWITLFLLLGFELGGVQYAVLEQNRSCLPYDRATFEFILSEDSKESNYGSMAQATIASGSCAGQKIMLFFSDKTQHYAGDLVRSETKLEQPSQEYETYYNQKGIVCFANITSSVWDENPTLLSGLYQLRKRMLNIISEGSSEQTFLRAVLLGERGGLFDASFYHGIKVCGLAHLVAVSGAHLVIVTGFVALIFRRLKLPNKLSVALQTLFLVVYVVLVGFPISCIRAAIMSGITLFALLAKRRSSSLTALGVTSLLMVAINPSAIYQLSFQLSVLSTFGIVLFMPLLNEWMAECFRRMPSFMRESLSMTLAALIFSLPVSAAQFSLVSVIAPLANVIATPYLTIILVAGFTALFFSSVFPCLLEVTKLLTSGLIELFSLADSFSGSAFTVDVSLEIAFGGAIVLACVLWAWWPRPTFRNKVVAGVASILIVVSVGVFGFLSTQSANDEVIMLNVGQGDSFVFRSGGKTLMVDTGNEPEMLYAALARNNISKLDAVLITHPDSDHCGSLSELAGVVEVDKIILADGLDEVEDVAVSQFVHQTEVMVGTQNVEEVATGSQICFGKFTFQVVAPNSITNDGGNEDSICFYLLVDCDEDGKTDWTGFFCGDAEAEELENLEEEGQLLPVDIYKVGHHGSKKALTSELAHVLNPRIALIGVGKNSYGHPTQETLSTLGSVGAQIFRSDECGDVTCEFKQDAIDVSTSK